jgi:hypothetical protein
VIQEVRERWLDRRRIRPAGENGQQALSLKGRQASACRIVDAVVTAIAALVHKRQDKNRHRSNSARKIDVQIRPFPRERCFVCCAQLHGFIALVMKCLDLMDADARSVSF